MTPQEINRFFRILSQHCEEPVEIILTGAAAGALWGSIRPSIDIDFAIRPKRKGKIHWSRVQQGINRTVRLTGITVNYSQDIDRWGQISLLDYREHTFPYCRFKRIEVRLMDPTYWSIGKVCRYLDPDVRDLIVVLSRQKVSSNKLTMLWGKALRASPASLACFQFRQHVESFLRMYGPEIWSKSFDFKKAIRNFHRYASDQ